MAEEGQGGKGRGAEGSGAQSAVHRRGEGDYRAAAAFVAQANASDPAIRERFAEDKFPECFREYADLLTWDQTWHTTLDTSSAPIYKWFTAGRPTALYHSASRPPPVYSVQTLAIFLPQPSTCH